MTASSAQTPRVCRSSTQMRHWLRFSIARRKSKRPPMRGKASISASSLNARRRLSIRSHFALASRWRDVCLRASSRKNAFFTFGSRLSTCWRSAGRPANKSPSAWRHSNCSYRLLYSGCSRTRSQISALVCSIRSFKCFSFASTRNEKDTQSTIWSRTPCLRARQVSAQRNRITTNVGKFQHRASTLSTMRPTAKTRRHSRPLLQTSRPLLQIRRPLRQASRKVESASPSCGSLQNRTE